MAKYTRVNAAIERMESAACFLVQLAEEYEFETTNINPQNEIRRRREALLRAARQYGRTVQVVRRFR